MRFRGAEGVLGACWGKPGDGSPKRGSRPSLAQNGPSACGPRGAAARADKARNEVHRAGTARGNAGRARGRGSNQRGKAGRGRGQTGSNWARELRGARANEVRPKVPEALESAGRAREVRWARAGCQPAQTRFTRAGSPPKREPSWYQSELVSELRLLLKVTMADQSEITLGVGVAPTVVEHEGGRRKGRGKSRDPSRAREDLGDLEKRLAKVELHLVDGEERSEEMDTRLMELDERMEELRGDMQGALNAAFDKLASEGARNAKEIDNFLWSLEQYFRAIGITDDAKKVDLRPCIWWILRWFGGDGGTATWRKGFAPLPHGMSSRGSSRGSFTRECRARSKGQIEASVT
ncbi:hypothetical protein GH714_044021 [Hevea brasiliensis]|uniref:Uncharacterized protein n=1 Tax=Hevea brasiliensis TaxID=3981 RepID=A0A6A6K2U7_HEVBR|nr:hypothetical protein GH714_044021 [Hevea brasiliensis]